MSFPKWLTEAFNVQDAIDELKKQNESMRQVNNKLWNEKRQNANKVTELRRIMRELKDSNAREQKNQAKTISQLTFETEMQAAIIDDQLTKIRELEASLKQMAEAQQNTSTPEI
jgi:hypothetical protein